MKGYLLIFLSFFITVVSCGQGPDKDVSNNFIGTWTSVKCIATEMDGGITYPTEKNLWDGGYQVDGSMPYYSHPSRLTEDTEEKIIKAVRELVPNVFLR